MDHKNNKTTSSRSSKYYFFKGMIAETLGSADGSADLLLISTCGNAKEQ